MKVTAHLVGLFVLLVALIGAPVHFAAASVTFSASPMMEMADGSPCPPKDCATMLDCKMAMPGVGALFAGPVPDVSVAFHPEFSSDVFDMGSVLDRPLAFSDGLRRPPKI